MYGSFWIGLVAFLAAPQTCTCTGSLQSGPAVSPPRWPLSDLDDNPIYHALDNQCPEEARQLLGHPLFLALHKRIELSHICAPMRAIPAGREETLDCQPMAMKARDWCDAWDVSDTVSSILPVDMLRTIHAHGNLTQKAFERALKDDLRLGIPGTRIFQMKWFKAMAKRSMTVCWPQRPGFTPNQFLDIYGYLGALLVNSSTLHLAVPERFMNYPPGYPNRNSFHLLDWRSYHPALLSQLIQSQSWHRQGKLAYNLRNTVDRWSGAVGRVLFQAMDADAPRNCPPGVGCLDEAATSCNTPIVPRRVEDIFRIFLVALQLKLPLVVSWKEASGPRPPGVWIILYRREEPPAPRLCIASMC
ncbi:hypothetical protein CDD81_5392 [Ophiocordyceps australis]|uniref:Uncharacterized protein n=1 Tax=Ophiocordyceps australis TaxID=1399860 RepID=A0A2C5Y2Y2_9HYPO|nr:hypothetical protein CDD81_5392 [Ophiocordyceps australis]